jgi:hypothetical protein
MFRFTSSLDRSEADLVIPPNDPWRAYCSLQGFSLPTSSTSSLDSNCLYLTLSLFRLSQGCPLSFIFSCHLLHRLLDSLSLHPAHRSRSDLKMTTYDGCDSKRRPKPKMGLALQPPVLCVCALQRWAAIASAVPVPDLSSLPRQYHRPRERLRY